MLTATNTTASTGGCLRTPASLFSGASMAIGKTLRFEIFKRDGFTCQYCGNRPPDVILEIDHIDPRANNGSDDTINLITTCFDCNRGKRDRKLGDIHPRPDADLEFLKVQQEIEEVKRYLAASKKLQASRKKITRYLEGVWSECMGGDYVPTNAQWSAWLSYNSPEEVEYAIRMTGPRFRDGKFGNPHSGYSTTESMRYISGIIRRRAEQKEAVN